MAHPKDEDVYPIGTTVRRIKTGEFARITDIVFQFNGKNFLHYLGEIEGREGKYCLLHDEVELEVLPPK